jgi:hypothetical protein
MATDELSNPSFEGMPARVAIRLGASGTREALIVGVFLENSK